MSVIVISMNDCVYRDRDRDRVKKKCVFTVMCFDVQYLIQKTLIAIFSSPEASPVLNNIHVV